MCVLNTQVTNNKKQKKQNPSWAFIDAYLCLLLSFMHFFKETDIIAGDSFRALHTAYVKKKTTMTMNDIKEIKHLEGCDILYCIYCSHNAKKKNYNNSISFFFFSKKKSQFML